MADLKKCPFCGRIPKVEDCGTNRFFVKCKCGIAQDKLYFQRCDAIRRWNTRRQQPEQQWIPCSEPPKESGTYIVTAYDGADKRVTFVKYQKTLKRWDLTGARAYWRILAYKPLPEPWRGEEHVPDE